MGEVVSIHIVRCRNGVAEPVEHVTARTNYGLEGDWRSKRDRAGQVTLIEAEALEEVADQLQLSIPSGASRRQIVVRGVRLNELIFQRIRVGDVHLFVEDLCEPCERMEETIGLGARMTMQGRGGVRCRVLQGGEIHLGDAVAVEPFPRPAATPL